MSVISVTTARNRCWDSRGVKIFHSWTCDSVFQIIAQEPSHGSGHLKGTRRQITTGKQVHPVFYILLDIIQIWRVLEGIRGTSCRSNRTAAASLQQRQRQQQDAPAAPGNSIWLPQLKTQMLQQALLAAFRHNAPTLAVAANAAAAVARKSTLICNASAQTCYLQ
jgi:hypothetical protein